VWRYVCRWRSCCCWSRGVFVLLGESAQDAGVSACGCWGAHHGGVFAPFNVIERHHGSYLAPTNRSHVLLATGCSAVVVVHSDTYESTADASVAREGMWSGSPIGGMTRPLIMASPGHYHHLSGYRVCVTAAGHQPPPPEVEKTLEAIRFALLPEKRDTFDADCHHNLGQAATEFSLKLVRDVIGHQWRIVTITQHDYATHQRMLSRIDLA
jgi:hypothetical protein